MLHSRQDYYEMIRSYDPKGRSSTNIVLLAAFVAPVPDSSRKELAMSKAKIWFCVPPFALCMLDQGITLVGQTPEYWAGNRSAAMEGNPWFHWLLLQHPLAFEAGIAVWVCVFSLIIFALPRRAAMTVSIAIVLGHAWGAATWICWFLPYGYWFTLVLFFVSAILIVATWEKFGQSTSQSRGIFSSTH